jgi:hypothetical protein
MSAADPMLIRVVVFALGISHRTAHLEVGEQRLRFPYGCRRADGCLPLRGCRKSSNDS